MLYIQEYRTQSDKLTLKSVTPRTPYVYQRVKLVFMQLIVNSLKLSVKLSDRKASSQTNQKVNSVMLTQLFNPVCNVANNELTDGHFRIWPSYHSMYAPCLGVNIDMWQCADVPLKYIQSFRWNVVMEAAFVAQGRLWSFEHYCYESQKCNAL